MTREEAEILAKNNPYRFFLSNIQDIYPDIGRLAAENLARYNPSIFFSYSLQDIYTDLEIVAAENAAKTVPNTFFFFHFLLHKKYPHLLLLIGEK